jgi:hypothetical protein
VSKFGTPGDEMVMPHPGGFVSRPLRRRRIARVLIADLDESPRLDFWAAVLRTFDDTTLRVVADGLEDRSDDPITRRVFDLFEHRFGKDIAAGITRFGGRVEEAILWDLQHGDLDDFPGLDRWSQDAVGMIERWAANLRKCVPDMVTLALTYAPVPVGRVPVGRTFHFTDPRTRWRVTGRRPGGWTDVVLDGARRRAPYPMSSATLVHPIGRRDQ